MKTKTLNLWKVDYLSLSRAFVNQYGHIYVCVDTGLIYQVPKSDNSAIKREIRENPSQYVRVADVPSSTQYQWIEDFIETIDCDEVREKFYDAIDGKKAFSRFKEKLSKHRLRNSWYRFRDKCRKDFVDKWFKRNFLSLGGEA